MGLFNLFNGRAKGSAAEQAANAADGVIKTLKKAFGSDAKKETFESQIKEKLVNLRKSAEKLYIGHNTEEDEVSKRAAENKQFKEAAKALKAAGVISTTDPNSLTASDNTSLEAFKDLSDIEIVSIANEKGKSAEKSGLLKNLGKAALFTGSLIALDQTLFAGQGTEYVLNKAKSLYNGGLSNAFNSMASDPMGFVKSLNPFDLAANNLVMGPIDPGAAKILAGGALLIGSSWAAAKIGQSYGGMVGVSAMLLGVAATTWLGRNSSDENNVSWSSQEESYFTSDSSNSGYADVVNKYLPKIGMYLGS